VRAARMGKIARDHHRRGDSQSQWWRVNETAGRRAVPAASPVAGARLAFPTLVPAGLRMNRVRKTSSCFFLHYLFFSMQPCCLHSMFRGDRNRRSDSAGRADCTWSIKRMADANSSRKYSRDLDNKTLPIRQKYRAVRRRNSAARIRAIKLSKADKASIYYAKQFCREPVEQAAASTVSTRGQDSWPRDPRPTWLHHSRPRGPRRICR
jgi:hypothetical protein